MVIRGNRILHGSDSPQQGDLRLSGPPSSWGAGGGARSRDRRAPTDLRADSLATVPPRPVLRSGERFINIDENNLA
ncbi:hypothetical protein PoB_000103500 [Plakobranchus ocellatus]|uniref:Uncharacterized protein n=1 Tax=Plakobranchus ocellatus TaxID=259542 RepID=A0AAV3XVU0_9GAST|nr:hypothetical protein PoB_000103500 [Plakobranchus ocellatus]